MWVQNMGHWRQYGFSRQQGHSSYKQRITKGRVGPHSSQIGRDLWDCVVSNVTCRDIERKALEADTVIRLLSERCSWTGLESAVVLLFVLPFSCLIDVQIVA